MYILSAKNSTFKGFHFSDMPFPTNKFALILRVNIQINATSQIVSVIASPSQNFQNKFTSGLCKNLRQLHENSN